MCNDSTPSTASAEPPATHRGAENTWQPDWLAFTAPDGLTISEVVGWLLPVEWLQETERGGYGYLRQSVFGGVHVYHGGRPGMGTHVSITGSGLRDLEALGQVQDWRKVLEVVIGKGWKVGRLDIAVDDHEGVLTLERVEGALADGTVVSRFKGGDRRERFRMQPEAVSTGWTVYLGSEKSDVRVRIYDKQAEQVSKGKDDPGEWKRVEWQFRDKQAHALAMAWVYGGSEALLEACMGYLSFRERSGDSNRSRWEIAAWWVELLGVMRGRPLRASVVERTVERARAWVDRQVGPLLAVLWEVDQGDGGWLWKVIEDGRRRWRAHHRLLLSPATVAGVSCR